jgi:hypothetical protein
MDGVFRNQATVATICFKAMGNSSLYRSKESQRFEPGHVMSSNRNGQKVATVSVPVLVIDYDHVRWRQVRVVMGKVSARVVDIVDHPLERERSVELQVTHPQSRAARPNQEPVF